MNKKLKNKLIVLFIIILTFSLLTVTSCKNPKDKQLGKNQPKIEINQEEQKEYESEEILNNEDIKKAVQEEIITPPEIEEEVQEESITYSNYQIVNYMDNLEAHLCVPDNDGTYPTVIFNHGGLGGIIGGDPEEVCKSLAEEGYIGFSPIRSSSTKPNILLDELTNSVEYILGLNVVDKNNLAMMGFSRGGMLTYTLAAEIDSYVALVLMAPAPPMKGKEDNYYESANNIVSPVLILVSENDIPEYNREDQDHVELSQTLHDSLIDYEKESEIIVYDAFENNGHELFYEVNDIYWNDLLEFLEENLDN